MFTSSSAPSSAVGEGVLQAVHHELAGQQAERLAAAVDA
jgi:hypothetical protein